MNIRPEHLDALRNLGYADSDAAFYISWQRTPAILRNSNSSTLLKSRRAA
jgi:hypothetical protein